MSNDERGSLLQRHLLLVDALLDSKLTRSDCIVLAVIIGHINQGGAAWPGVTRIQQKACVARSTVMRGIKALELNSYLEIERERGKSNTYRIAEPTGSGAGTSSEAGTSTTFELVAAVGPTGSGTDTTPVPPVTPHPSQPSDPNSALELSSSNSEKRTRLPAAPSLPDDQEQEQEQQRLQAAEQQRLADEEEQTKRQESLKAEYLQTIATHPKHAEMMRRMWPFLADVIEDRAA